ncbi:MAG: hypothetical protein HC822_04575 [Oscillochloris sp.]|nr:hypothetical protein [Oscillochloris sp.]
MGRWWWPGALLFAIALTVVFVVLNAPGRRFSEARQRWITRAPSAYALTFKHDYMLGNFLASSRSCRATVAVRPGRAPQLIAGDCDEALTVEAIFDRFGRYARESMPSRMCGYGTCLCAVSTFRAVYDRQHGFPLVIARDWQDRTVGRGQFWSMAANLPAPLRNALRDFAEQRTPCPPGTLNHTPNISPIHRETITILAVEPLD